MKTVIVHGQNHKGSSYNIGRALANKVATEDEITEFFLPKDLNHFCLGCYRCLESETKCPFYDEKHVIESAIESAELLIFTTPTYCMRASAPMKSFIDLTFINWMPHRPKKYMFQKKAVVVSTAAGAGASKAIKDITTCLFFWGVPYIKTLGFNIQAMSWEEISAGKRQKIEKSIDKLCNKLKKVKIPKVGFRTKFVFNLMRLNINNKDYISTPMANDYWYWHNNGWLEKKRPWL